jgi:hypothetical protein
VSHYEKYVAHSGLCFLLIKVFRMSNTSVARRFPPYEDDSKEHKIVTLREGKNTALIVVDVQVGVMNAYAVVIFV